MIATDCAKHMVRHVNNHEVAYSYSEHLSVSLVHAGSLQRAVAVDREHDVSADLSLYVPPDFFASSLSYE